MKAPTTSEISHNSHGAKSVLVTGATRGIGRAIADELGRDHHIIVGGRHQEAVDNVVSEPVSYTHLTLPTILRV